MFSHELRNPLAALSTALAHMERPDLAPEKQAKLRATCRRQITNLVRLVDDLLDVFRITRGRVTMRRVPVDLGTAVTNAITATNTLISGRHHHLEVSVAHGAYPLEGDPARIEQVVAHLLVNAAKFTDPGGRIELHLDRETHDGQPWGVLRVRDSGRGIPEHLLNDVFEAFVQVDGTLDRAQGGLGIGLTLVKRLVELHGGSVFASSQGPGKGTEVVARLPLLGGAQEQPPRAPQAAHAGGRERRILIVEDNDDARETLKDLLLDLGHRVETANDGPSGLKLLLERPPDVALIDVGLPGLDGYELARRAREAPSGHTLYLVALTGYDGPEARSRAVRAGFDRHVVKPLDFVELPKIVGEATVNTPTTH